MDNFDKFTELINYIEANLDADIEPKKMSQILCVNEYTMYRIFTFLTGMTLTEYIRKRRLSMAAIELQNSDVKIIDLAIKYGYENSESFSRSFYKFHGIKPSKVKKEGKYIKNFPPYSFSNIRTNKELHYKIEEHDEIELYGIPKKCYIPDIKKIAPAFWKELSKDKTYDNILNDYTSYGVIEYDEFFSNSINANYYIASKEHMPHSKKIIIPKSTWAVFKIDEISGDFFNNFSHNAYRNWVPYSGYNIRNIPELEVYNGPSHTEWWLPIETK